MICIEDILLYHLKEVHHWSKSKGFTDQSLKLRLPLSNAAYFPITCQIFYTKEYTRYFLVNNGRPGSDLAPTQLADALEKPPLSLQEQVKQTLAQKLQAPQPITSRHKTKVSPWLDLTQWERYFRGHNLESRRTPPRPPIAAPPIRPRSARWSPRPRTWLLWPSYRASPGIADWARKLIMVN